MKVNKIDVIPLKMLIAYVVIGVTISILGPIKYHDYEQSSVIIYMLSFLVLFTFGYLQGVKNKSENVFNLATTHDIKKIKNIIFWVKLCILIMTAVQFYSLVTSILKGDLNLSIANMGRAYLDSYDGYVRGTGNVSIVFLIQTLTYVPYLVSLILGAFYFKRLPRSYKIMIIFIYLSIIIIETIGHGKQKQFGDILIFLLITWLLKTNIMDKKIRKKIMRKIKLVAITGAFGLIFILSFRYVALEIDTANINEKINASMHFDTDHVVFDVLPDPIAFPVTIFSGYLSQGYYGLSLSMQQPFEWTYFVGNSYSLTVFLHRYMGIPVDFHDSYPYRASLVTDWDDTKWSTVFAWFAGDFTFIGTLFFFAFVAFLYSKVWREAYRHHNPIAIVLFSMLTIALLYIPANNQLMHTPGSVIAVIFFVILWVLKHRKYNFYNIH